MKVRIKGVEYDDDDWVVVSKRKPVKYYKNPKSNKAPASVIKKLSSNEEIMRIKHARKTGIL